MPRKKPTKRARKRPLIALKAIITDVSLRKLRIKHRFASRARMPSSEERSVFLCITNECRHTCLAVRNRSMARLARSGILSCERFPKIDLLHMTFGRRLIWRWVRETSSSAGSICAGPMRSPSYEYHNLTEFRATSFSFEQTLYGRSRAFWSLRPTECRRCQSSRKTDFRAVAMSAAQHTVDQKSPFIFSPFALEMNWRRKMSAYAIILPKQHKKLCLYYSITCSFISS